MMVDNLQNHTVDEESIKRVEGTHEDDCRVPGRTVDKKEEEQVLLAAETHGKDHVDEEIMAFESNMPETKESVEEVVMLTLHEKAVEEAILKEDVMEKYVAASCHSASSCYKCKLLNQPNFIQEKNRYESMWNNCKAMKQQDGTFKIFVDYQFRDTIHKI